MNVPSKENFLLGDNENEEKRVEKKGWEGSKTYS
jgi:hypothetical protein